MSGRRILPLVFTKRLCDVFDDEISRIAREVGSRAKAFKLVKADKKLVRFYLPLVPKNPDDSVWSFIRTVAGWRFVTGHALCRWSFNSPLFCLGLVISVPVSHSLSILQ